MESLIDWLGGKKKKQENLFTNLGISGDVRKELVGVDFKEASVVAVKNEKFMEMLEEGQHNKFLSHLVNQSDTHQYHELYLEVGKGVYIKTAVTTIDYSQERTLMTDLHQKKFQRDQALSKDKWSVFKQKNS